MKNYFYYNDNLKYPINAPYMPSVIYPEYPFADDYLIDIGKAEEENLVYLAVRNLFIRLQLDKLNINKSIWNPLGQYIEPGQTVLLKPNLVNHYNPAVNEIKESMDCLITHPSIVRCIFDYVYIALKGKGKVIIADAPIQNCEFDKLLENTGYGELFRYLQQKSTDEFIIQMADLREVTYVRNEGVVIQSERSNPEFGSHTIDLCNNSFFYDVKDQNRLRITNYAGSDTTRHHKKGHNEYKISDAVLDADVIISLPKPKSHRIAGYTAALKNMIGINARKEYIPHHRKGKNGDEYIGSHIILKYLNSTSNDIRNWAVKKRYNQLVDILNTIGRITGRKLDKYEPERKKFGMWYGNDTLWRSILDINHIVYYADKYGHMQSVPQRRVINIGDMVVCGDHEGPLNPSYKRVGGILFTDHPLLFDLIVVKLMGFDWQKFPLLLNAIEDEKLCCELISSKKGVKFPIERNRISELSINSNDEKYNKRIDAVCDTDLFHFVPTNGWKEYLWEDKEDI